MEISKKKVAKEVIIFFSIVGLSLVLLGSIKLLYVLCIEKYHAYGFEKNNLLRQSEALDENYERKRLNQVFFNRMHNAQSGVDSFDYFARVVNDNNVDSVWSNHPSRVVKHWMRTDLSIDNATSFKRYLDRNTIDSIDLDNHAKALVLQNRAERVDELLNSMSIYVIEEEFHSKYFIVFLVCGLFLAYVFRPLYFLILWSVSTLRNEKAKK
jgi:hypothetical protein